MPVITTKAAASSQGFGEFTQVAAVPAYIEDVFSTHVYTGNGTTQTIANSIALNATTVITDSGPNSITATPSAGVTTKVSSPFASVAYSVDFSTPADEIVLGSNSALTLTGNFTIEAWLYQPTASQKVVIGSDYTFGYNNQIQFNESSVAGRVGLYHDSTGMLSVTCSSSPVNTWFHLALVRSGTVVTVYLNGVSQGTMTTGATYDFSSGAIGALRGYGLEGWVGDMSCFRIVNGTAVYTANFTPSTTPLTAIANTALLLQLASPNAGGSGGLVWLKNRSVIVDHALLDSNIGGANFLSTNTTAALASGAPVTFNSTGLSITSAGALWNQTGNTYASWTFRRQPKFFDMVVYKGNGTVQNIAHSLGSVPGLVIVKRTDTTENWGVYHRTFGGTAAFRLNQTAAISGLTEYWNDTAPTSTQFTVGSNSQGNAAGGTYVAYLFAHNAGGFGPTGTDNAISCGAYAGNGTATGPIVTLGYEPQWVLVKNAGAVGNWAVFDNIRGITTAGTSSILNPNLTAAETSAASIATLSTGFQLLSTAADYNAASNTYIYMAIRRGPMRVPTDATKVFQPVAYTGTNVDNRLVNTGIVTDMAMARQRTAVSGGGFYIADRLRGNAFLYTAATTAEATDADSYMTPTVGFGNAFSAMNGFGVGNDITRLLNPASTTQLAYAFKRAPGFFDEVCYTGTGAVIDQAHNLAVTPELIIFRSRSAALAPRVIANIGATTYDRLQLNATTAAASDTYGSAKELVSQPTATSLSIGTGSTLNNTSAATYVAYLFASCPGVSKVGTYTGTATTQVINCGFTAGARFVMIKCTSAVGDWYVWDTARGIVAGNDPYLLMNSTAIEATTTDYVDTAATGFELSSTAPAALNASGGTFIFLAIA